jgi:NADH-quinone oxidoreductase subunit G
MAGLLPWGRPLSDPDARAQAAQAWHVDADTLPAETGLDLAGVVEALATDHAEAQAATAKPEATDSAASDATDAPANAAAAEAPERRIGAVILAGVEAADTPDPEAFLAALAAAPFVLALETRSTEVTAVADVVLPVGVITEKSGTLLDWEGRARPFGQVMRDSTTITDARALSLVARAMGRPLGSIEVAGLRAELAGMGRWQGPRPEVQPADEPLAEAPGAGHVVLASWRHLLDEGILQRGEQALAGTARPALARVSAVTADAHGLVDGDPVTVTSGNGSITLPLAVTEMVDGVVWIPGNSIGSTVNATLRAGSGAVVALSAGGAQ